MIYIIRFFISRFLIITKVSSQSKLSTMSKLSYVKLQPFKSYSAQDKITNEQRFWKKYQNNLIDTYKNTISSMSSNRNAENIVLFSEARSLRIYDTKKQSIVKEIHSFDENLTALCVRPDAAVMAVGDESGSIEVMDTKQKFHLRTFKHHKKRINALQYLQNALYSGGDDFIVRQFDVAVGDVVHSYQNAHGDYIKSIRVIQNNHILTAGYDGFIRLFDFRVHKSPQIQFQHREPVECVDLAPSKLTFIASGGNKVSLWDVKAGKPLFAAQNNKKMVSSVKYVSSGSRFITTSLDHYLKVYRSDTFEMTYQDKLVSPILTFDITNDDQHLFLGLEGGKLMAKSRKGNKDKDTVQQGESEDEILLWMKNNQQKKFAYNDQYFYRGIYEKTLNYDIKFEQNQNRKFSQYDALLKKFQYKEALLMSLEKKNMMIYLSLIDQYIQRNCLDRTIISCTEDQIQKLLSALLPLLHNVKYSKSAGLVLQKIVQLHKQRSLPLPNILYEINRELWLIDRFIELEGMMELLQNNFQ